MIVEGAKFGAVGVAATLTHVAIFLLAIDRLSMAPSWANLFAFCLAVWVSFVGNFYWTFRIGTRRSLRPPVAIFAKFILVALTGLALNSLVVFLVVEQAGLSHYIAAALMATAVPAVVFVLSKFWAFS